jgi:hypothetical protein
MAFEFPIRSDELRDYFMNLILPRLAEVVESQRREWR